MLFRGLFNQFLVLNCLLTSTAISNHDLQISKMTIRNRGALELHITPKKENNDTIPIETEDTATSNTTEHSEDEKNVDEASQPTDTSNKVDEALPQNEDNTGKNNNNIQTEKNNIDTEKIDIDTEKNNIAFIGGISSAAVAMFLFSIIFGVFSYRKSQNNQEKAKNTILSAESFNENHNTKNTKWYNYFLNFSNAMIHHTPTFQHSHDDDEDTTDDRPYLSQRQVGLETDASVSIVSFEEYSLPGDYSSTVGGSLAPADDFSLMSKDATAVSEDVSKKRRPSESAASVDGCSVVSKDVNAVSTDVLKETTSSEFDEIFGL